MKKINVLYDATPIVEGMNTASVTRAGIFWCAYNILKQFNENPQYKITLLVPPGIMFKKKSDINNFLSSFPSIKFAMIDQNVLYKNIKVHKNEIVKTRNIIFIMIRIIKIFYNMIMIPLSKTGKKIINNFDVFFSPVYTIPEKVKKNKDIILFHILHDCIASLKIIPTDIQANQNDWYIKMIQGLNKGTYYFCNSECTKNGFLKLFPKQLDESKMFAIPHATSQNFNPNYDKYALQKVLQKYGIIKKTEDCYIFSFCSINPRKNIVFTIKCFIKFIIKHKIDNLYFFLGGAHFPEYINQFEKEIDEFANYKEKIIRLGYVYDEDVNILYSNSMFFTYLSQYEGFGVPPLEAMQAGTPVICSNNSSLPEVVGDAAITIPYNDENACIKAFEDLYFNEELRKFYINKGLERAKLFSWKKTFTLMNDIIMDILSKHEKNSN